MMCRVGIGVAVLALTVLDGFAQTHEPATPARGKVPRVSTVVRAQQPAPPTPAASAAAGHEGSASSGYVATGARAPKAIAGHGPRKSRPIVSGFRPASPDAGHDVSSDGGQAPTGTAAPNATSEGDGAASGKPSTPAHAAESAAVTATVAKTSIADQVHVQAPPAARGESAAKPTKLSDVHSRITAALAELAQAATQTAGDDPADGSSTAAVRPAPRIRLEWPLPHLELEWPDALQPDANRPPAAPAPSPRSH
jgi:hypothetical protein